MTWFVSSEPPPLSLSFLPSLPPPPPSLYLSIYLSIYLRSPPPGPLRNSFHLLWFSVLRLISLRFVLSPCFLQGKGAKLEKGKFTWITEQGSSERWIVASCGNFSVLWNFTSVKQNKASDSVSHGGLVTCTTYNIIPKDENVVDSVFLHEGHNHKGHHDSSLVVATRNYLWACAEDDEEYEEE